MGKFENPSIPANNSEKPSESLISEFLKNNPELARIYNKHSVNPKINDSESGSNTRMQALTELAVAIKESLPDVQKGYVRLWRGNREGEVGHNPSYTNSLEGIALPFLSSYGGILSYVDVPEKEVEKYLSGGAPGAEFILPPNLVKDCEIVGFNSEEAAEIKKKASPLSEADEGPKDWSSI